MKTWATGVVPLTVWMLIPSLSFAQKLFALENR
jgi:hypothetical protein